MLRWVVAVGVSVACLASCTAPIDTYFDQTYSRSEEFDARTRGLEGHYSLPRTIFTVEIKPASQQQRQGPTDTNSAPTTPERRGTVGAGGGGGGAGGAAAAGGTDGDTASKSAVSKGAGDGEVVAVENITLSKKVEPDPFARLLYRLQPSSTSDDILQVETDEGGLLTSVSSDTYDRSGSIAVAVADLVFAVATKGAPSVGAKSLDESKIPLKISFDPTEHGDSVRARDEIFKRGYCLLLGPQVYEAQDLLRSVTAAQLGPAVADQGPVIRAAKRLEAAVPRLCRESPRSPGIAQAVEYARHHPGIYYRRATPFPVALLKLNTSTIANSVSQPSLVWAGNIPMFDRSEIYRVDIDRAAFVRKQTNIKFANGSLTSIKVDKPSEVLAGVLIPVQIARIAFAIPLAGLQQDTALQNARVANVTANNSSQIADLNAQTAQLNAQISNLNAQTQLLKLQAQTASNGAVILTPQ